MRFKISLTTRLSLIFSAVMLPVLWLSSFILISTLNGYFDNQDRDFLTGKLQLTEEFLKTETFRNKTDIKSLSEKINDAMVGHNGLFISIKNMENEKIVIAICNSAVTLSLCHSEPHAVIPSLSRNPPPLPLILSGKSYFPVT